VAEAEAALLVSLMGNAVLMVLCNLVGASVVAPYKYVWWFLGVLFLIIILVILGRVSAFDIFMCIYVCGWVGIGKYMCTYTYIYSLNKCIYACICTYLCIYIYTYTYAYTYTYVCKYAYIHTHVYIYIYMYLKIYIYRHMYIFMYIYVYIYTYIYIYTNIYIYVCICIYMYIHIYI